MKRYIVLLNTLHLFFFFFWFNNNIPNNLVLLSKSNPLKKNVIIGLLPNAWPMDCTCKKGVAN